MKPEDEKRAAMLAKVRKLLAMGRDGRGNANEEEIAMRQASRLMAQWGIEEAEVNMAALDSGAMIFGETEIRADGQDIKAPLKSFSVWCGVLAVGVARFTDTVTVRGRTERGETLKFSGEKEDVLLARWLFGVLAIAIQNERAESGWKGRADGNAFCMAAASTVATRLRKIAEERKAQFQEAARESNSRALIVVDRKMALIAERFGKQRTRSTSYGSRGDSGATMAGRAAGGRINIPQGRPVASTTNKRLRSA